MLITVVSARPVRSSSHWDERGDPSAMTATEYDTQPSDTIVAGVGAHADTHHVVVLDRHGHRIADSTLR